MPVGRRAPSAAVEADAANPAAHELWGALLASRSDLDDAARELQTAVKLQPGYGKAQFELGMVLYLKGDSAAAVEHLRAAAAGADPEAKASAEDALKKMGK